MSKEDYDSLHEMLSDSRTLTVEQFEEIADYDQHLAKVKYVSNRATENPVQRKTVIIQTPKNDDRFGSSPYGHYRQLRLDRIDGAAMKLREDGGLFSPRNHSPYVGRVTGLRIKYRLEDVRESFRAPRQ